MSSTPLNADDELRKQIHSINRLGDYKYTPSNVVLVTIEDIVELVRQVAPYTMSRLDEAAADRKKHELQAIQRAFDKVDRSTDFQEWNGTGIMFRDELLAELKQELESYE